MINGRRVLALIPARGGSKGIPGKNLIDLGGKPLIGWTIEAAAASQYIDRVVLSSDDQSIIDTSRSLGCEVPFVRPAELAADNSSGMDVVQHALSELAAVDLIVLLQPTSPLRSSQDIDAALEKLAEQDAPALVSVVPSAKPPEWLYRLDEAGSLEPLLSATEELTRRQDARPVYYLNGAIYIAKPEFLGEHRSFIGPGTIAFEMPAERSIDIDEASDLELARHVMAAHS